MSNLLEKASILLTPTAYDDGKVLSVKPEDGTGDFDFTRNSSATRVNSQGLVEDVQILSSNLVQNGDFSQEGAELVTNGDFATDSDWTKQTSWSISGGAANYDFLSDAKYIRQTLLSGGFVAGKVYKINFDITSGTAYMNVSSNAAVLISLNTYSVGSYSIYVTASASGSDLLIYGRNTSGTAFSIDNVSVKEVGQDWILGTGITIGENKAIFTSTASGQSVSQNAVASSLTNGALAKVSFEVLTRTEGSFGVYFSGTLVGTLASAGVFTAYFTKGTETSFYIRALGTTSGSISNVSVIEVTDDTNLPRIDYSPYSGAGTCGHWLFEPQSTNLFTQSETFSNWQTENGNQVVTTGVVISPDGTQNGNKLVTYNGGETQRKLWVQKTVTPGESYTFSVYIKKVSGQLNTGFLHITTGPNDSYDATQEYTATDQWQRISVTTSSALSTPIRFLITGDSDSQIYIWGAQLEQNSYPTSYIPTSGSTVTRNQEAAFGAGSSDLINSTEGVLYAEIAALADDLSFRVLSLSDGTNNNTVKFGYRSDSNKIYSEFRTASSSQSFMGFDVSDITEFNKVAFKYKENDFALWVNGVKRATDTSGAVPNTGTFNSLSFNRGDVNNIFFGKTKCVAVFKEALTDEELTCLTTI